MDLQSWLEAYQKEVVAAFGERVVFFGLQGSHARREASKHSDIDVVLILDKVGMEDLIRYRSLAEKLPHRERLCGFVSGREELANWSESDRFQFYFDTVALQGSLEEIFPRPTLQSARQAVLLGACNLYHGCSHNFLHAQEPAVLQALCKAAFFVMQADCYCKTREYPHSRPAMQNQLGEEALPVFQVLQNPSAIDRDTLGEYTQILLEWSAGLIGQYGANGA